MMLHVGFCLRSLVILIALEEKKQKQKLAVNCLSSMHLVLAEPSRKSS